MGTWIYHGSTDPWYIQRRAALQHLTMHYASAIAYEIIQYNCDAVALWQRYYLFYEIFCIFAVDFRAGGNLREGESMQARVKYYESVY